MSTGLGRGRPPLPSAVKRARGTAQPSRMNKAEPKVEARPLPAPPKEWPEERQAWWTWLARLVDPLRVAAAGDVAAFRRFVLAWCTAEELSQDPDLFDQWVKAEKLAQGWLVHFGLSPVARAKAVQLEAAKSGTDPLAEFMQ